MADVTPQKRVLPARERRESAAKRLASSPPPPPMPVQNKTPALSTEPRQKRKYTKRASLVRRSTPSNTSTPPVADDLLPTRLTSARPLPTSRQKQATQLSDKDYQSIGDSAILAASLHRSRMQWLCDGIFEKYWTRPVKRKGVIEAPPNNPDQKSMQKLGNGTMTIEPHTFDVSFFVVRDPLQPLPYYRHPNQHTPKPPTPNTFPPAPAPYYPPTTPVSAHGSPTQPLSTEHVPSTQPPTPTVKQESTLAANPNSVPLTTSTPGPASRPEPKSGSPATPQSAPAGGAPKASTDPVIQMLAARAATDPRLKELMKVVATSKASPDQLKEFQGHIDEFNAVVKRQEAERAEPHKPSSATPSATPQADTGAKTPSQPATPAPMATPAAAHPSMYNSALGRGMPPGPLSGAAAGAGPPTPYMAYPPPPPPRPEPIIKHIVVEFTSNATSSHAASSDRWLFPEYAVLDIRYGGLEMVCSFFVERKGRDIISAMNGVSPEDTMALQAQWKPDLEYYQPVTITVKANQHRTIESIARAAKSLPAVQERMKEVMKHKTRAPEEWLVHQLPRERGMAGSEMRVGDFVDSAVELGSEGEDDELKDWYGNC